MADKNKDCGCDEKKDAAKGKSFLYDRTGYNVDRVVGMSEDKFVDHPMHTGNYTHLEIPQRIEQLKKIYRAILNSAGISTPEPNNIPLQPLEVITPNDPKNEIEGKDSGGIESQINIESNDERAKDS